MAKKGEKKNNSGAAGSRGRAVRVTGPSLKDLRPTDESRQELQRLLNWEKRSEQRDWVVGRPFK